MIHKLFFLIYKKRFLFTLLVHCGCDNLSLEENTIIIDNMQWNDFPYMPKGTLEPFLMWEGRLFRGTKLRTF
jgi:hypothetical protein